MHVAALKSSDARQYRELMLEAYVQAADAFTSTAEERRAEPISWWVNRIAAASGLSQCFGAFQGQALVGTVALEFTAKPKTRHSGLVIGMYVQPSWRGKGAGAMLMSAAIAAARAKPELQLLRLTVTEGNGSAIRLYESLGFVAWGVEPQAISTPSGYKGKVHMSMHLRGNEAAA
jgi:RimJ/RimL family protein N-acetyltransferase